MPRRPADPGRGRFAAVLAEPAFRRYFLGQTASQFGDRLVPVALAFAVLRLTHSAAALSLVLVSAAAGQLTFLLAGGVIADRWPRRAVLAGCDLIQLCVTTVVATFLLLGHASVPALAGAGAVQGMAAAVAQPAAAGLVPALVPPGRLADANSLGQVSAAATRVAGLAVAGVLVTARLRPRHPMRWALPGAACFALPPLAMADRLPVAAVAGLAVAGETGLLLFTRLYLTAVQQGFDPAVLSRVSSYGVTGSAVAYPLGLACAAPLAHLLTVGPALALAGTAMALSLLGLLAVPAIRSFEQVIE
jgi:MFS family permease